MLKNTELQNKIYRLIDANSNRLREGLRVLEDILTSIGAETIENPNKTQCCGSFHTVDRKDIVAKLTYDNLKYPIQNGADMIVTCCPLCAFNLDFRQKEAKMFYRELEPIPVVYYTQLLALAFGLDKSVLGFDMDLHFVDPKPVLRSKNLY